MSAGKEDEDQIGEEPMDTTIEKGKVGRVRSRHITIEQVSSFYTRFRYMRLRSLYWNIFLEWVAKRYSQDNI